MRGGVIYKLRDYLFLLDFFWPILHNNNLGVFKSENNALQKLNFSSFCINDKHLSFVKYDFSSIFTLCF